MRSEGGRSTKPDLILYLLFQLIQESGVSTLTVIYLQNVSTFISIRVTQLHETLCGKDTAIFICKYGLTIHFGKSS